MQQPEYVDPFQHFTVWYDEAFLAVNDAQTCAIATADAEGAPSVRMVYYRGVREGGFSFFTNYESRKGKELAANPRATLLFYWASLHRQIRIEGRCGKLSRAESERYFAGRPRESQLSAWASRQSEQMRDGELAARLAETTKKFGKGPIPCPEFWGGFGLTPNRFEFWTMGEHRRHERLVYQKTGIRWTSSHLFP